MENLIGKRFQHEGIVWAVISEVTVDAAKLVGKNRVFVHQVVWPDESIKTMDIDVVIDLIGGTKYTGPWPIVMDHYLQSEKCPLDSELEELGLSEDQRNKYRHVGSEIGFTVELYEDGTHAITHCNEEKLANPITN